MAVSNTADLFNQLFNTFTTLAIIVGVVVLGLMGYLVVRFRAKASAPEPEDAPQLGRLPQERGHMKSVVVSVTLSSIVLGVLIFGTLAVTNQITTIPSESECFERTQSPCVTIRVTASRFRWDFTYRNGNASDVLIIPTGRIVVLEIVSTDVFHTFGIEGFRIKKDAIPGLINRIWFVANEQTPDMIRCFELCGVGHAVMTARLSAVSQGTFQGTCSTSGC